MLICSKKLNDILLHNSNYTIRIVSPIGKLLRFNPPLLVFLLKGKKPQCQGAFLFLSPFETNNHKKAYFCIRQINTTSSCESPRFGRKQG